MGSTMSRWAQSEENSYAVVNIEATLERAGTRWAQGVRPSVEAGLSAPDIPATVENEPLSGPSGPVTKLPPCCCNNRQARAPWSPVLASKLKEAGIRPCPSYSSRSTPGDQGQAGHGALVNENLPESVRRMVPHPRI